MSMLALVEAGFSRILEATWQTTVLAGVVLVIQSVCRRRMPAFWRHILWAPVVLRLLVPFAPESSISLFNLGKVTAYLSAAGPKSQATILTNLPAISVRRLGVSEVQAGFSEREQLSKRRPAWPIEAVIAVVWVLGCVALLLKTVFGAGLLALCLKRRGKNLTEELAPELRECKERGQLRRNLQVVETDRVASPALFGFWKSILLLPKDFNLSQEELRHVLIHEITHMKRYDLEVTWLLELARCLHWFNPFVWLIVSRCRADAELACDEMALSKLENGESIAYGKTILKLLDNLGGFVQTGVSLGILENRSRMKQRIVALADYEKRKFSWSWMVLVLAVGITGLSKAKSDQLREVAKSERKAEAPVAENDSVLLQIAEQEPILRLNSRPVSVSELPAELEALAKKNPELKLTIRPDQKAGWSNLVSVMDAVKAARIKSVDTQTLASRAHAREDANSASANGETSSTRLGLWQELVIHEANLVGLRERYTDKHPWVTRELAQIEALRQALQLEAQRGSEKVSNVSKSRRAQSEKLRNIIFDEFSVNPEKTLGEVIKEISARARVRDPQRLGVNIMINSHKTLEEDYSQIENYLVRIEPPVKNVSLADLLDTVAKAATPPLRMSKNSRHIVCRIYDYAVVFQPEIPPSEWSEY